MPREDRPAAPGRTDSVEVIAERLAGRARAARPGACRMRLHLGREQRAAAASAVVDQRLVPDPIAREEEPAGRARPRSRRRTCPGGARRTPSPYSSYAWTITSVSDWVAEPCGPAPRARCAELAEVVDLAVEDDPDASRPRWSIGWSPPARSMIARRRWPRPTPSPAQNPSPSGPRCAWTVVMAVNSCRSTAWPATSTIPAIPHMSASLHHGSATGDHRMCPTGGVIDAPPRVPRHRSGSLDQKRAARRLMS